MAARSRYTLDGQPVTVDALAAELTAYGKTSIRDALRTGIDTRAALLDHLTHRSVRAFANHKARPKNIPKLYFAKSRGG